MCQYQGSPVSHTWQGQLRPHHGAARRQRRGADPEKNHEPGQRHGWDNGGKITRACDPARTQGASPLHPRQGSRTLGTREKSLTAALRTKERRAGASAPLASRRGARGGGRRR